MDGWAGVGDQPTGDLFTGPERSAARVAGPPARVGLRAMPPDRSRVRYGPVTTDGLTTGSPATPTLRDAAERYTQLLRETLGDNLVSVVLFGSVAREEATSDSDIDLLVVCEELPPGRFARLRLLDQADRRFDDDLVRLRSREIDTRLARLVRTRDEATRVVPLYLDLVQDAQLLHDTGGFFASVLARLAQSLERLGAERRMRGRVRYWVLKRDFVPGEVFEL